MQGFNRYYPPDFDPKQHDTLNAYHGKHALGDRARKLDQGILIVRFELPFNIWCGGCGAHIGMGVRYNAEKKKVGNYYSTPVYAFRCKCHLCDHWFTIQTDPQNTKYVVTEGAKAQAVEWDDAENGGIVLDKKDSNAAPPDAFEALEKKTTDKKVAAAAKDRLEDLYDLNDRRWSNPFELSQRLRRSFRTEKASLISQGRRDDAFRDKYSLPADLDLGNETADPNETAEARRLIGQGKDARDAKRRRTEAETGHQVARTPAPSTTATTISSGGSTKDAQVAGLRSRLRLGQKIKADPFLAGPLAGPSRPDAVAAKVRRKAASTAGPLGLGGYGSE